MKLLISILLMFSINSFAQGLIMDDLDQNFLNDDLLKSRYGKVSGSPYYNEEFTIGTVSFINGAQEVNVLVRVDIFEGAVQIKKEGHIREFDNNQVTEVFLLDSKSAEITKFKNIKINNQSVLVLNYFDKKIKFFGFFTITKRISSSLETGYSSADQQDKFVKSKVYYLYLNSIYSEVKLNKKSFLNLLGEEKETLDFIKSNKIKFNQVEDIVNFLKYMDNKI